MVARRSLRRLKPEELKDNPAELKKREEFDADIKAKLGDSMVAPSQEVDPQEVWPYNDEEGDDTLDNYEDEADPVDDNGMSLSEQPLYDRLLHAEVCLPQGERMQMAKVLRVSKDSEGRTVGNYDDNPILNTIVYDVEFPDGAVVQYAANIIQENLLTQVDPDGHQYHVLDSILEYATDDNAVADNLTVSV